MNIQFNSTEPIYIQIVNYFKKQIASSCIEEGDKLPSVRELAVQLKVNPNTIQRSYTELERENLVFTKRGMGKYVTEDKKEIQSLKVNMAKDILDNFIEEMKHLGFNNKEIVEIIKDQINEED